MSKLKISLIAASVPVGIVLIVGAIFGIYRWTNAGEVLGDVVAEGVDLGGLGQEDAATTLAQLETDLATTPIEVTAAGKTFTLIPGDVGYDIDTEAMAEEAFTAGRIGNVVGQLFWWMGFGDDPVELEMPATYDPDAVQAQVIEWELEGIDEPPFVGNVEMVGYSIETEYPRAGTGIDYEAAAEILGEAILDPSRPAVVLPTRSLTPVLTDADIDDVVARANSLLSGPVTLWNQHLDQRIEIPRHVLAESLVIQRNDDAEVPTFEFSWDNEPLAAYVEPRLAARFVEAVDARLAIGSDDVVRVIPSIAAQEPETGLLASEVEAAVGSVTRIGPLGFRDLYQPDITTEDIEALGIKYKLSEFTTYHPCCESRVTNIQTIADAVDGAMVMPGETWSLNDHVGQRTIAKGYVRAGAIIDGYVQCCDSPINIGGGTSQFTTTMYNAIFYAGLEDVFHFPHTIWFSRYPEGIEATLGYPEPDLIFRNNTESIVLIKTEHTGTSITVKMFGDNGGITVTEDKSDRYGRHGAITSYVVDDELDHCTYPDKDNADLVSNGSSGWYIKIRRIITFPEGHYAMPEGGETTEEWIVHYEGAFKVYAYNPVAPPGGCP